MKKIHYHIHHQYLADCPKCGATLIDDLGPYDDADGIEISCPQCNTHYQLETKID